MIQIAVFASGAGSNAQQIIQHFAAHPSVKIALVLCNKPGAGVLDVAAESGVPVCLIEKENFFRGSHYLEEFSRYNISFIVLAGFLWKVPSALIHAFPDRMLNIHPALLPNYGGKGMYGKAVHEAVIAAGEKESGITIHYVDERYDHGRIFFQTGLTLSSDETPDSLADKIHVLEHRHFPEQIARWLECKLSLNP